MSKRERELEEEIARLRDLLHRVDELIHNGAPVPEYWYPIQEELEREVDWVRPQEETSR